MTIHTSQFRSVHDKGHSSFCFLGTVQRNRKWGQVRSLPVGLLTLNRRKFNVSINSIDCLRYLHLIILLDRFWGILSGVCRVPNRRAGLLRSMQFSSFCMLPHDCDAGAHSCNNYKRVCFNLSVRKPVEQDMIKSQEKDEFVGNESKENGSRLHFNGRKY